MGLKIAAPVWYDGNDAFLNGELLPVDSAAVVVGVVAKPSGYAAPGYSVATVNTLFVKDNLLGGLYLNLTLAAWQALIKSTSGSPSPIVIPKTYTISIASNTIVDAALLGATLLTVSVTGISQDPAGLLSGNTLTFANQLQDGDSVSITYYIN